MEKQEKLSSTFFQKHGAPHNFAKFRQNEQKVLACELMNLIQVYKNIYICYLLISETILSQVFFKIVLCARRLDSSSSQL